MRVKRIFILCVALSLLAIHSLMAQSQIVSEMGEAVTNITGSFLDNPYHHSNTKKIFDIAGKFDKALDEMYDATPARNKEDLYIILNMKNIVKWLDFITANIVGYSRGGFDASEWETKFNPILTGFGWTWKVLHSTEDIIFYEYSKDGFKMVMARNILPKKDYGDYNAVAFSCDTWDAKLKRITYSNRRVVFGGNYQFVDYGDDENVYKKFSRFSSKRGSDLSSFK